MLPNLAEKYKGSRADICTRASPPAPPPPRKRRRRRKMTTRRIASSPLSRLISGGVRFLLLQAHLGCGLLIWKSTTLGLFGGPSQTRARKFTTRGESFFRLPIYLEFDPALFPNLNLVHDGEVSNLREKCLDTSFVQKRSCPLTTHDIDL